MNPGVEADESEEHTMGAWGTGNFENDHASDWALDLVESGADSAIEDALDGVLATPAGELLVSDTAVLGLAAAEVVAALGGRPAADPPEALRAWTRGRGRPAPSILRKARASLTRVAESSELRELWEESGELDAWLAVTRDLGSRLGSAS